MERVPQYIDVEDHIAGPFTWKQLGWFFGAGGILLLLWNTLEKGAFWIAAVPIVLIATALAFYRPHGVPLINFIGYAFTFVMQPKMYIWKREEQIIKRKKKEVTPALHKPRDSIALADIQAVTQTLDSHGEERNEGIDAILKKHTQKKKKL